MSSRQLVQVIVGSEAGSHLPVKRVPHVDWVVTATAGETAEDGQENSKKSELWGRDRDDRG